MLQGLCKERVNEASIVGQWGEETVLGRYVEILKDGGE